MFSDQEMEKIYRQSLHPDMLEDVTCVKSDFKAKSKEKMTKIEIGHNISFRKEVKNKDNIINVFKVVITIFALIVAILSFIG